MSTFYPYRQWVLLVKNYLINVKATSVDEKKTIHIHENLEYVMVWKRKQQSEMEF